MKGNTLIDYNKAIKMLSMVFRAGYDPTKIFKNNGKSSVFDSQPT